MITKIKLSEAKIKSIVIFPSYLSYILDVRLWDVEILSTIIIDDLRMEKQMRSYEEKCHVS